MPYGEVEVKSLGLGEELASEPCFKRLKSTEEASVFSRDGGADSPRVQEKTGPDRAPAATSDSRGSRRPQEDESQPADLSRPLRDGMPQDSPDTMGCVGSQEPKGAGLAVTATDDGIYSTSKAFIGPVYQPPEKKGSGRRKRADPTDRVGGPAGREGKRTSDCRKSEIDSELFQFYKEIEELENDPIGLESSCQEAGPPWGLTAPCSQEQRSDGLGSEEEKGGGLGDAPPPHCSYQQHLGTEPGSALCDGRVLPPFYDVSCVSFRPEWQSLPSFIMPRGPPPPLPGFDCHLDVQRFHVPADPPSSVFRVHSDAQPWSGCYGDGCPGNWTHLAPDQSGPYAVCGETGSSALPPGGEYSAHDGAVLSGFYETREDCWEAPPVDQRGVAGALVDQRCPQENLPSLQKSLILLRGLPGSGKTTLSRVLLGQSRDGIVFSTDDYFRYRDGYRYNVDQLGDAHDWNQNRAKQAMAQGRSPVIIDNTNTQAWEMKPYVEMAIGKGYRVEFHEPETWWKFDPEELEKRNKHGVSRKKIAQMLERYEFHVSVAVVLNSVEPVHKGAQRPPPPWRPREGDWQETGHGLRKLRHKRNRRRNRAQANDSDVAETDTLGALGSRSPEALEASPSEEEDSEESPREPGCSLTGDLGHQPMGVLDVSDEESWGNTDPEGRLPDVPPALGLCSTPKNCLSKEGDSVFLSLSSTPGATSVPCPAVTLKLPCVTRGDCSGVKAEEGTENPGPRALGTQDRGADVLSSLTERKETGEDSLCRPHRSRAARQALTEQLGVSTRHTDSWALFPTALSDKEWQWGSVGQPRLSSWPEGPHTFICEQRPKKERGRRRACPDGRGDLVELVSTPGGVSGSGSSLELSVGEKLWTEDENLSSVAENVDLLAETGAVSSHLPEPGSLPRASALMDTKRGQRITFSVAPNFDLHGPANNVKERGQDVPFIENHGLEFVCGAEKEKISEINSEEDKEENHATSSHHPVCFYLSFIKDAPLVVGGQFYACCLSFHRLGHAVCFYKSPVLSLGLPSFWKVSFMSKSPFLTSRSHTRVDNKQDDARLTSPELFHHQPDALHSLKVPSGLHLINERVGEKPGKEEAARPLQSSQTEDNQASTRTRSVPTGLPLPQEFARQLVRLFGSPGIPMDLLSPEDFVVPLDQQTLKRLYLQWKVSVEKRQKKAA